MKILDEDAIMLVLYLSFTVSFFLTSKVFKRIIASTLSTAREHVKRNEHRQEKICQRFRDFRKDIYSKKCPLEITYKSF